MANVLFLLGFAAGIVQSVSPLQPTCDSPEKPQWGYDKLQNIVCYEHVRVVTIAVGPAPVHPSGCAECDHDSRILLSNIKCDACVTAIEPYVGPSKFTSPITTTIYPPSGSDGRPTVIVYTPTTEELNAAPTEYVPYTGTSPVTAPVTTTIRPGGTGPPTILVETPEPTILGDYVTITVPYTGSPPITRPITRTVPPTEEEPGTIIIETPPVNRPVASASSAVDGEPEIPEETGEEGDEDEDLNEDPEESPTPTPTPTESDPEPTPPEGTPAGPTFDCDEGGYLIQQTTLYRLDLATGDNVAVNPRVGPGGNINAMGFNILDGYLYAFVSIGGGEQQLIRIGADGTYDLLDLIVDNGLNVGDVDDQGRMWASDAGRRWLQVDLNPDSSTFGEQVDEGVSENGNVADWVYLEDGGDYLYSIRLGNTAIAQRWSRSTHEWETIREYTDVIEGRSGFGALYAVEGELWGSDNQSGDIIAFPVLSDDEDADARKISDGPSTSSNDGARCFRAPAPGVP